MNDPSSRIQIEKPVPPWEQPGCFRLDCEPHRGKFLRRLAHLSAILSVFAWVPVGVPLGLAGAILALVLWWLAKQDQRKMWLGLMDPSGRSDTAWAERQSREAFWQSLPGTLFWGAGWLLLLGLAMQP